MSSWRKTDECVMGSDERMAGGQAARRCTGCGQSKPLEAFGLKAPAADGRRRARCRECANAYGAAYRALHPERQERYSAWRRELRAVARSRPGAAAHGRRAP